MEALARAEGFDEDRSDAVAALPVEGQAAGNFSQQTGGQVSPRQDSHKIFTRG